MHIVRDTLKGYTYEATYTRQETRVIWRAAIWRNQELVENSVSHSFNFKMGTDREIRASVQGAIDCYIQSRCEIDWM